MKCGGCDSEVQNFKEEAYTCNTCKQAFHPKCVGSREEKFRKLSKEVKEKWRCIRCSNNTEGNNQQRSSSPLPDEGKQVTLLEFMSEIDKKLDLIRNENSVFRKEISDQLSGVTTALEFNSDAIRALTEKNEHLEKEVCSLKKTLSQALQENKDLKHKVENLTTEIIDLQQYSRRTNIELCEFPEVPNENLNEVGENILKKLEVENTCTITAIHRLPSRNPAKTKPIVIQFQSKTARDICLQAAKKKKLQASDIKPDFKATPVYFNEHLCRAIKSVYFEARKFKKNNNYKFCWVRDSKIYLRKNDDSNAIKVRSVSDLPNVP